MKKTLLLCVSSQSVITFRVELIKKLQENGHTVSVIAFDDEYEREIKDLDVAFYCIKEKNRGINPLKIFSLKSKYYKLIREVAPDIVFTFMLKPNTFGVLAAQKAKVRNIYSMVEGAGDVFIHNTVKWKIVRLVVCLLYKKAFKYPRKVFFLNDDDKSEFLGRKLLKAEQCEIIRGIGVDIEKFSFKPLKNQSTFLMIARMLESKGIYEYCKCARIVKQKYPEAVFNYIGAEGAVSLTDIKEYIDDGSITYLGTTKDVRPYLENCSVFVLPSYREGMPMSVMESIAVGRAVITSDTVGCKDTVESGYNGFLVAKKDFKGLAEKCMYFIDNPKKTMEMGENSRELAVKEFDSKKINQNIYEVICR